MKTTISDKILLVEDNQVNCEVAIDMLETLGCDVDIAINGEQAVKAYQSCDYKLILMDCEMPVMDGFLATKAIREREQLLSLKPIPIIALTAHAVVGAKEKCLDHGMNDFLSKPFNMSTLDILLKKWFVCGNDEKSNNEVSDSGNSALQKAPISQHDASHIIDVSVIEMLNSRQKNDGASLMKKVVCAYLLQSAQLLQNLTIATEQSDIETIRTVSHALKSSSINVGAIGFSELCKKIERHCEQGEIKEMLIEDVHNTYVDVELALTEILQASK
ncbi:MAG: response regulator [Gammaproteobacteria bacterium]|nr:response regulator [Gammaproteobacteria bacterium]